MKSYQIIIGRDPTCDEDSDLEAQLWLQFPSRNSVHSPKPSLVHGWEASCSPVKRKIQIQNDEGKNHKSLFIRHQSALWASQLPSKIEVLEKEPPQHLLAQRSRMTSDVIICFSSCLLFYQLKNDKYSVVMEIWQCGLSGVYPSWMPHWSPTVFSYLSVA